MRRNSFLKWAGRVLGRLRWFHHLESAAIAFTLIFVLSCAVLNFRIDSTIHEWGNFLTHFDAASPASRRPVEIAFGIVFALLFAGVAAARKGKPSASISETQKV